MAVTLAWHTATATASATANNELSQSDWVQGGHVIHRIKGMFDTVKWGKPQHSQSGRKVRQGIHQRRGYLKQQDRRMELTLLILACHLPWLDPPTHNPRVQG